MAEIQKRSTELFEEMVRHVSRLAREAGERLLNQQRERAEQFQNKQLPVEAENILEVAVVEMDGGRTRTRAEDQGIGMRDPA